MERPRFCISRKFQLAKRRIAPVVVVLEDRRKVKAKPLVMGNASDPEIRKIVVRQPGEIIVRISVF
jgi:hypothetical protein